MLRQFDVMCRNIRLICWAWEITMLPSLIPVLGCPASSISAVGRRSVRISNIMWLQPQFIKRHTCHCHHHHHIIIIIISHQSSVISRQSSVVSRHSSFIIHHHHSFVHSTSLSAVVSSIICHHQSSSIIVSYHPLPSSVIHPSVIHQVFVSH